MTVGGTDDGALRSGTNPTTPSLTLLNVPVTETMSPPPPVVEPILRARTDTDFPQLK
jgi:hypothetical protein